MSDDKKLALPPEIAEALEQAGVDLEATADGLQLKNAAGSAITLGPDGKPKITLSNLKSVGIRNIVDVQSYSLTKTEEFVMHDIEFVNGGRAKMGYSHAGRLMELSKEGNVVISVSRDNALTFSLPGSERD